MEFCMKPFCNKCYSTQVYPVKGASLNFPESLNQTVFSPTVLASVGVKICKNCQVNPMIGMAVGTLFGVGFSIWQQTSSGKSLLGNVGQDLYYCSNCQNVFKPTTIRDGEFNKTTSEPFSSIDI